LVVQKGFSHGVAPNLIRQQPGKTAVDYASQALEQGLADSDAKTPVQSLANTLEKEAREGRLPEVRRVREGGVYRYYPADQGPAASTSPQKDGTAAEDTETITLRVPRKILEVIDLTVEVGAQGTRNEAILWLCQEGMRSNNGRFDEMRRAADQIQQIKRRFSS
jgi:hypothetical protein